MGAFAETVFNRLRIDRLRLGERHVTSIQKRINDIGARIESRESGNYRKAAVATTLVLSVFIVKLETSTPGQMNRKAKTPSPTGIVRYYSPIRHEAFTAS